jgi:oxygen-independent coproporphyrinogen-3 oxidase
VFEATRACGFESISIDLIYGLPLQTVDRFRRTLEQVVTLAPDRVSIFNYAHLPERFSPQKRISLEDIPAAETKLAILELCIEYLEAAGYVRIGMDHFAKPDDELAKALSQGDLHRNFQGYSTYADCDMFAFGVTAISKVGHNYWQSTKDLEEYCARVEHGRSPLEKGLEIDMDDQIRGRGITDLMCHFRIDFDDYEFEGRDFAGYFSNELDRLALFAEDDLVVSDDAGILVTDRGRLLIRNICMVFDRHLLGVSEGRYFKALQAV